MNLNGTWDQGWPRRMEVKHIIAALLLQVQPCNFEKSQPRLRLICLPKGNDFIKGYSTYLWDMCNAQNCAHFANELAAASFLSRPFFMANSFAVANLFPSILTKLVRSQDDKSMVFEQFCLVPHFCEA